MSFWILQKNCPHNGANCPLLHRLYAIKRGLKIIEEKSKDENQAVLDISNL